MQNKEIQIGQALTVCAELTGTQLSPAALNAMLNDLLEYDTQAVLNALNRCRRELTGRLTLAAILSRMDTDLISADEAFGLLVDSWKNESLTLVIPEIAMQAMGMGAQGLLDAGDKVGARMAFKEAYNRLAGSLKTGEKPQWFVSAGTDKQQMTQAIMQAVDQGRLTKSHANALLPSEADEARHLLETGKPLSLEDKTKQAKRIAALLEPLKAKIGQPHWLEVEAEKERQAERERFEQARQKALAQGAEYAA